MSFFVENQIHINSSVNKISHVRFTNWNILMDLIRFRLVMLKIRNTVISNNWCVWGTRTCCKYLDVWALFIVSYLTSMIQPLFQSIQK